MALKTLVEPRTREAPLLPPVGAGGLELLEGEAEPEEEPEPVAEAELLLTLEVGAGAVPGGLTSKIPLVAKTSL